MPADDALLRERTGTEIQSPAARAPQLLSEADFRLVVSATPLISIDLVIEDEAGRVLLGLRRNRPAQGFWFVPGGRIRKNERMVDALRRIGETEVGLPIAPADVRLAGVHEHFYEDSVFGEGDAPDTHYVALAYELRWPTGQEARADPQHEQYAWWTREEALQSPQVHTLTKAYLNGGGTRADRRPSGARER